MSHAPPQECFVCAKPMFGETISDSRIECDDCGFHCCGACLYSHIRRAHPSTFMAEYIPKEKVFRGSAEYQNAARAEPADDNVIYVNFGPAANEPLRKA